MNFHITENEVYLVKSRVGSLQSDGKNMFFFNKNVKLGFKILIKYSTIDCRIGQGTTIFIAGTCSRSLFTCSRSCNYLSSSP
jgi:hypothetical protein